MKVRINSLPKGFTLNNGKVSKGKAFGGSHTGDQEEYGLTTIPSPYTTDITSGSNSNPFADVNTTLGPVPREEANLEAEVGETTLTDMNNDGDFELYNIGGKRHHKGGTPLNLPPQSFIYSDTGSMKLDKYELAEMGIDSKDKKTPAAVSKNYQLNKYYSVLNNEHSDRIAKHTAEYMLQKNKQSLSQLAFLQEAKKDFKDGVPLASYPYLHNKGIDPIQFSMTMENLTRKEAEERAIMQLPIEDRKKIMQLKEIVKMAESTVQSAQSQPAEQQMMSPQPPPPQMMQAPVQQAMPIPMARFGGAIPKFQGDEGSSEVNQIDLMNQYNQIMEDVNQAQNDYINYLDSQKDLYDIESANQYEEDKNDAYNKMLNAKNIIKEEDAFNANVKKWVAHIEAGGTAPDVDIPAYNEAYKEVYGKDFTREKVNNEVVKTKEIITKIVKEEENNKQQAYEDKMGYNNYMTQEMLKNFYLNRDTEKQNTPMPMQQQGYQLEWTNKNDPYYVGSEFATGDTLETMKYGGSVKSLKRFDEGGSVKVKDSSFPITLRNEDGEVIYTINNQSELNQLENDNPSAYSFVLSEYSTRNKANEPISKPVSSKETKKTYKGFDSWSDHYESDSAAGYRKKRYQAYVIMAEKEGVTPLSEDQYHSAYANYMREVDAFRDLAENDEMFQNNPNWDSQWEWEQSDTPCAEGETGCKEYGGNTWRTTPGQSNKKDQNWFYKQQQQALGLTDSEGNVIEPMDSELGQHMQIGMNAGLILEKTGQGDDTYDAPVDFEIYKNMDVDQINDQTGASKADGYLGNNTMFNAEHTYDIIPAEGCTNAEEIKAQCDAQGGTFIPWDPVAQTGCTCEVPEPVDEIPVGEVGPPAVPPKPAFWLQDELALANAIDARASIEMDLPWAPKYAPNLIDPVFKDPTREIAAIQEGAKLVADSAAAFSGPQRANAVTLKAQGNALKQVADTVNRVHSDNITIANTVNAKNAEILYKTQILNNNEAKQLYDNTNKAKQAFRDSKRKANAEVTNKLMKAYTNMANTYNLNTLYDQFNIHPETGGMVAYNQQPDSFYDDPSALQTPDPLSAYTQFYDDMLGRGVPPSHIPTFDQWSGSGNTPQGSQQNEINNAILQGGYAKEGKELKNLRLAKKGMELKDFLNE